MRRGNIFESERYTGAGVGVVPGVTITLIVCSVLSVLAAVSIVANWDEVTARIAICVANLLTSGFLILAVIAAVATCVIRLRWTLNRWMWRW